MDLFDTKKMQEIQLNILDELKRICKKNNLSYALAFGTCLGAIRHQGFIPWDDDIDVYMPINDFNKLVECRKDFNSKYFLQTSETDPEFGLMIGRLRDSETTLIEKKESCRNINHGVFVDIYPLFFCPKSKIKQKMLIVQSMILRLSLYGTAPQNRGLLMKYGAGLLLKLIPQKLRLKIAKFLMNNLANQPKSDYISSFYGDEASIRYAYNTFYPFSTAKFEGREEPVPRDYDLYLRQTYGDYMKLPPAEKQVIHHDFEYVDFDNSYKKYYAIHYCRGK